MSKKQKIFLIFLLLPLLTQAAGLVPCGGPGERDCTACHLLDLVQNVWNFALRIAFLIVIIMFVYGGLRMIFSVGDPKSIEAGKKTLTSAIIGLVIILAAWLIVNTIFWFIAFMGGEDYTGNWFNIQCPK